jgi:hypothetical protein
MENKKLPHSQYLRLIELYNTESRSTYSGFME